MSGPLETLGWLPTSVRLRQAIPKVNRVSLAGFEPAWAFRPRWLATIRVCQFRHSDNAPSLRHDVMFVKAGTSRLYYRASAAITALALAARNRIHIAIT